MWCCQQGGRWSCGAQIVVDCKVLVAHGSSGPGTQYQGEQNKLTLMGVRWMGYMMRSTAGRVVVIWCG